MRLSELDWKTAKVLNLDILEKHQEEMRLLLNSDPQERIGIQESHRCKHTRYRSSMKQ